VATTPRQQHQTRGEIIVRGLIVGLRVRTLVFVTDTIEDNQAIGGLPGILQVETDLPALNPGLRQLKSLRDRERQTQKQIRNIRPPVTINAFGSKNEKLGSPVRLE